MEAAGTASLEFENSSGKIQPKPTPLVPPPNLALDYPLLVISIATAQATNVSFDLLNVIGLDEGDDVGSDDVPCTEGWCLTPGRA